MRIVVEFTIESRADLFALLAARVPTEGDATRFGELFLEDIEQQFRDHEGMPPDVESYVDARGMVWWWRYVDGIWLAYTFEDSTSWMFQTVRSITVLAFEPFPRVL